MVAGTRLFIPVFTPSALFFVGDGHAGQGNGEVDITAMETSLVGTFQLVVRKDLHLKGPRGETPTHWIAMGLDPDLNQATVFETLRERLPGRSSGQVSRLIKGLRTHGLVKKTAHGYTYYLTPLGRQVVATGLRLKEFEIRQELSKAQKTAA